MTIKIVSLNIWWGGKLMPGITDFLNSERPDVVAMQEVYNGSDPTFDNKYRSMEVLLQELPYQYFNFTEAYQETIPEGKVPHGNAVMSKFPIVSRSFSYLAEPTAKNMEYRDIPEHWPILPAVLQLVELATPAGKVNLFNMHGVWDLDGDNYSVRRRHMSEVIIAETSGNQNVILTGDTNAKASNQAMRQLEKHLKPVFGEELITTFNMRHKDNPGYATAAVDLMYISPEIEVIDKRCPDVDISDHLPLVVTLEI